MLGQVLHVNSCLLTLANLQTTCRLLHGVFLEQVLNFFIIDLQHRELNLVGDCAVGVVLDPLKNLFTCLRHDALVRPVADHGVTFARARLPIGKQAAVVALPGVVEHLLAEGVVARCLVGVLGGGRVRYRDAVFVDLEAVMGPEAVVESERANAFLVDGVASAWILEDRLGTLHVNAELCSA